jgi:hypothetical protein
MQHPFRTRLTGVVTAAGLALVAASSVPATAEDKPGPDGWVQLFNGKDLTGWKLHPDPNKGQIKKVIEVKDGGKLVGYDAETKDGKTTHLWRVENGMLIGSGPASHLFSERDDYDNFHYRVEAKINDKGNSGQYFRTQFGPGFPKGYEAQINATHGDKIRTGSLYPSFGKLSESDRAKILVLNTAPHGPDEFFTQEVIADGPHIRILVNGKQTIDWTDPNNTFTKGHFALQGHDPGTVVMFKKIEYKPIKK